MADSPQNRSQPVHSLRRDYTRGELIESTVSSDPIEQFAHWFNDVLTNKLPEPNAMTLATADASGRPSARIVLLKGFDQNGFVFYTNYASRKGRELAANPRACLVFFWEPLERQVRIEGSVVMVSRKETEQYFHSRPTASQVGAWVSQQSAVLGSRHEMELKAAEAFVQMAGSEIPVPDQWGGYRVIPDEIEFWQGRPSRLHDRLVYTRSGSNWTLRRLWP